MNKRIAGCTGLYERIKAARIEIGLKTFIKTPTEQAKVEQLPICFMNYGTDNIIKRSSRTSSSSRPAAENICALEILFEIVCFEESDIISIFKALRKAILSDIYPAVDTEGAVDYSVSISEDRKEGPLGYGIPDVVAFIFVVTLTYPDKI
jgi:hypothetical protein